MAVKTETFAATPGQTLYAHPEPDLSTWGIGDITILCNEGTGPNTGLYSVTYDETVSLYWGIFVGLTQPVNWNARIGRIFPSATGGGSAISIDPQAFSNLNQDELNENELALYENETRTVLFSLTSGTFGDVPLKFVVEAGDGTTLLTITGLQSATNALSITITPLSPGTCCGASWSIRKVTGNTVIIAGPLILTPAPG